MKSILKVSLISILVLLLCGCAVPQDVPAGICPPEILAAPLFVAPSNNGYVAGPTGTLEWTYPDLYYPVNSNTLCHPEKFRLTMKKGPLFIEAMVGIVDGSLNSWVTSQLEPGAEYQWSVVAMSDNSSGPSSGTWKFTVGESCGVDPVVAPTPLQPFNGATLNHLIPTLVWDSNVECIPEGYHIDIATDPDFGNIINSIDTGNASLSYPITTPMTNCTRFYWRVAAIQGTNIHAYSETFSFRVATEGCEAEPGAGSINGKVWKDICPIGPTGTAPDPLPVGCVASGDDYSANGLIEPGEPGIPYVAVHIGAGTCAANTPLGLTLTNLNGNYFLWGLQEGTYCVQIDSTENPIWLGTGRWTYPLDAVGNSSASWEIQLGSEEDKTDANFGWQYENGGANPYNLLGGIIYHDLCAVPHGVEFNDPLPSGCVQHNGWVTGNYHHEPDEPGIAGVEVTVRSNTCSDPVAQTTITDQDGFFSFLLEPGMNHCVQVDSMSPANYDVLQPGVWSLNPTSAVYVSQVTLPYQSVVNLEYFSFAWDYSKLPTLISAPDDFEMYPIFKPDFDIHCRLGPDIRWQDLGGMRAGMKLPLIAITPDGNWGLVQPAGILNKADFPEFDYFAADLICWVLLETGTIEGDIDKLDVKFVPFVPAPTVSCSGLLETTCKKTSGCKWVPSALVPGSCKAE